MIGTEYAIFRWFFAADLATPAHPRAEPAPARAPRYALVVLAATLVGFGAAEPLGLHPAWVAAAGALVLATPRMVRRPLAETGRLVRAANLPFYAFVFALGIVVLAVRSGGVGALVGRLVPDQGALPGLLAAAGLAAVLANLLNNLPATSCWYRWSRTRTAWYWLCCSG